MIEGFAGFGVVVNPATQALTPTVNGPAIMIERLTKEIEKFCVGPLNLLETMKLEIYYRKTLTRKCKNKDANLMIRFVIVERTTN